MGDMFGFPNFYERLFIDYFYILKAKDELS